MASKRQKQVAEIIKRHFSTMLQQEGSNVYGTKPFVTVTEVQMTPDFNIAKIYLSIYNIENKQEVILLMEKEYHRLRQALAARIKRHVRRVPELQFFIDDMLDEMERVDQLFKRLESSQNENENENEN